MQNPQIRYWCDRESEERAAYGAASDPRVRDVHFGLAERYADAIWSAQETEFEERQAC
jgi:hypothetical protein